MKIRREGIEGVIGDFGETPWYKMSFYGEQNLIYKKAGDDYMFNQEDIKYIPPGEGKELLLKYYGVGNDNIVITFENPNLEQVIRDKINKPTGDIYQDDVINIEELSVPTVVEKVIESIEGIQYLENLEELWFSHNQVSDISVLENLTNLEDLSFAANEVSDINALENLANLESLSFWNNQVSDISVLENLTNLNSLDFKDNEVSDILPLVDNDGLGTGDEIDMRDNYLDLTEGSKDMDNINTLIDRGVEVDYEPQNPKKK